MNIEEGKKLSLNLIKKAPCAILSTIDEDGFPETRAMLNLGSKDFTIWFTTNTSSNKVQTIKDNDKACVYFCLPEEWRGLMLTGNIKVVDDVEVKKKFWQDGWEMYYPEGVNDPDYTILRLTPKKAKYYHKLDRASFEF